MAIKNPKHLEFIEKYIEYERDHIKAAMEVWNHKDRKTASTHSTRLLKNAELKAEIEYRIQQINKLGISAASRKLEGKITGQVLSLMDKRILLANIALGITKVRVPYVDKSTGRIKYIYREPTANERRLAIDLDAQLMGEKAIDKSDPPPGGGNPDSTETDSVKKLESTDLKELIKQMNASTIPDKGN